MMPVEERQARHRALMDRIRATDAKHWRASFLGTLSPQTHGAFA